jgi:hypothetical protein
VGAVAFYRNHSAAAFHNPKTARQFFYLPDSVIQSSVAPILRRLCFHPASIFIAETNLPENRFVGEYVPCYALSRPSSHWRRFFPSSSPQFPHKHMNAPAIPNSKIAVDNIIFSSLF